jgi:hypothetical protein
VKGLTYSRWSHKVLQLQYALSLLLRKVRAFERVRELVLVADSHQELRLRQQPQFLESEPLALLA